MTTPSNVREQLAEARRAGVEFKVAWRAALGALSPRELADWREALEATVDAWHRAYCGVPASRPELAVRGLGTDPERILRTGEADPWERSCGLCGGPIPAGRRRQARYCSRECQRRAHGRLASPLAA